MLKNYWFIPLVLVLLSSCASMNQSLNFEEDDVYYSNDFQHRFNQQALLMNKDVAMPDSAYSYFDETYANSIRPSYLNRINKFEEGDDSEMYLTEEESDMDYYSNQNNQAQRWSNCISLGVAVGYGYYSNPYYGGGFNSPYYSSYNSPSGYYYGGPNQRVVNTGRTSSPVVDYYQPYKPPGVNRSNGASNVQQQKTRTIYTNPNNSGINNSNQNRQYRTRSTDYTPPNYGSGSRSGSYSPSGTRGGYYRR